MSSSYNTPWIKHKLVVSIYSNTETSLVMSTLAIWCRVVQSRDASPHIFDDLAMSGLAFSVALLGSQKILARLQRSLGVPKFLLINPLLMSKTHQRLTTLQKTSRRKISANISRKSRKWYATTKKLSTVGSILGVFGSKIPKFKPIFVNFGRKEKNKYRTRNSRHLAYVSRKVNHSIFRY